MIESAEEQIESFLINYPVQLQVQNVIVGKKVIGGKSLKRMYVEFLSEYKFVDRKNPFLF